MQPGNYCRQVLTQLSDEVRDREFHDPYRAEAMGVMGFITKTQKFLLPKGGMIIDDLELKALADSPRLELPFGETCLEYEAPSGPLLPGQVAAPKRVLLCIDGGDDIILKVIFFSKRSSKWLIMPSVCIPKQGYRGNVLNGNAETKIVVVDTRVPQRDYAEEVTVLMGFLNALACSNVGIERLNDRRASPKVKGAFPFDSYHVLTIESTNGQQKSGVGIIGSHRSPREHLRRGHIRRLHDGRRIWVNAAVINAGTPGKVTKDYRLKP
jgi:hypothetical protein